MNTTKIKLFLKKYLGNKYILTLVVFGVWLMFFDKANVINLIGGIRDKNTMQKQKVYYQQEIKKIDKSLDELNNSNESLEKFAREQFYFKDDDEDVFIINEE